MRKIALVLSLIMLMGMSLASAEITTGTDTFNQEKWYKSGNFIKPGKEWVGLYKIVGSDAVSYGVLFSEEALKHIKFSQRQAEFKIDEYPIKQMAITKISSTPTLTSGIYHIGVDAAVPPELIDKIKIAKRVALKFYKENGAPTFFILPDSVLAEWQQIINTEK